MVSLPSLFQNTSNCLVADGLGLGSKGPHLLHGSPLADHCDLRALTKAHVLAPVAHPAAIGVDAHVAPILGLPVAHGAAHARAVVPGVDGINAVVSQPASLVRVARITRDLTIAALLSVGHVGTDVLTRVKLGSSNGCRAASHALVLAPVAHPAAVQVSAHVTPVLSLPVAVDRANSMAAIPLVHLVNAVVSVPAEVRVISSVTVDLSAVALLSVRLEACSSTASTAAVVAARACSGRTSTRLDGHAVVAQPASVVIQTHVAVLLCVPVAGHVANSGAAVPRAHLVKTVVSIPAGGVIVISGVAPDLSGIALLGPWFKITSGARARTSPSGLAVDGDLTLKRDPRSGGPGKSSRGKKEEREHLLASRQDSA